MFAPAANLRQATRFATLARADQRISAREIALLLACGALAAWATSMLFLTFRVPGHAILRAVLPMAAGLALVPRHSAGLVMAAGALITTAFLRFGNVGDIHFAALVSLLALGPMLDVATKGASVGWKLYARFAAAGAAANLLAFVCRLALAIVVRRGSGGGMGGGGGTGGGMGGGIAGGHDFLAFWPIALASFVLCGAVAGLVSAALWFRLRTDDKP